MLKLFKYLKPREWIMLLVSIVFVVVQVFLNLRLPDYMAEITRLTQTPGSSMSDIWLNGGYMMLCALGSLVAAFIVGYFAAKIAATLSQRLRSLMFTKVSSFSMEEINRFSTSSLITRSSNDITQIQMLVVMGLQVLIMAPLTAVWAMIKIAGRGTQWTEATAVVLLILIVTVSILMLVAMPKFKRMQTLTDNITRSTRENLTGVRVVRAYNAEQFQEDKFELANKDLTGTQLFTYRAMAFMMPMLVMMMTGLTLSIYWIGAYLIDAAGAQARLDYFSNMVVFSSWAMQIIMSFMMLVMVFIMLPRASVSAKRINEVIETESTIADGTVTEGKPGMTGEVEFRDVCFQYPDAPEAILDGINFKVRKGEVTAFIGSTGSGKSTLINLVPRFFDATCGEVLIDGVNVKDYKLEALYDKIGYVPQRAVLFKGTIESNVAYGDNGSGHESTLDEVKKAMEIAQGSEFVEKMDEGYESPIAQSGKNVSGGQMQRIAIARAIARKPEIYIFDDSFSALDYKTDRVLRAALKKETAGVTSLIVAQRIGTIMNADQIIVLDQGRIVGKGTHKELLKTCPVYLEIATSQLSEEELAS